MECAMAIQCANVVVDIVSCILDKLCCQVRNVSSVWVSSISLKLVHLFAVADLGGGGGGGGQNPPSVLELKKIAIADWLLQRFFFFCKKKCNMLMHASLHKKSRSTPALCMNSRTHMHDDEASR